MRGPRRRACRTHRHQRHLVHVAAAVTDERFARVVGMASALLMLLGAVLVVLKFAGTIAWSWWWVMAPFWSPFAALGALYVLGWFVDLFERERI